jgi:hypothetical protein
VFLEEQNAERHLHELWLRELECRAVVGGREVRLDTDYHPAPDKPEWVRRLEERGLPPVQTEWLRQLAKEDPPASE